jgi:protein ImuB
VISPLLPTEPLCDFVHLDFPISLVSLLLHQLQDRQKAVDVLFARLQGRRLFAQRLKVTLHCEYSNARHVIEIAPNTPSRDLGLFMTLLENRLSSLNLENPVRDIEIEVIPCPEQTRQLDFFEPRTTDQDKVETLFSLLLQSKVQPGFYQIEPCIMPEQGWRLSTTAPVPESARGHENNNYLPQLTPAHSSSSTLTTALSTDTERTADNEQAISEDKLVQPMPWYGKPVARAPRPTRLLRIPRAISFAELERLKILSSSPIERLESSWWEREEESSRPGSNLPLHTSSLPTAGAGRAATSAASPPLTSAAPALPSTRDYYFAVSPDGQCLWIFRDPLTNEYFLHGYFD